MQSSLSDSVEAYHRDGYAIVDCYDNDEFRMIEDHAHRYLDRLLSEALDSKELPGSLDTYHQWWGKAGVDHGQVFRAKNRYHFPPAAVEHAILNHRVCDFVSALGFRCKDTFDHEGMGWLGFRFVRPGMEDGYPMSCKEWGPTPDVLSMWLPVIGFGSEQTLSIVPGSHLLEYEKYLPTDSKFASDEYRLAIPESDLDVISPEMQPGQVLFYHPRLLHSEDVKGGDITRYNLEVRIAPHGLNN